jgi:hypothetical protein
MAQGLLALAQPQSHARGETASFPPARDGAAIALRKTRNDMQERVWEAPRVTRGAEIRCYGYVNRPYEQVRQALTKDALAIFQSATRAAASRAQSVAAELRADVGAIGLEAQIIISVKQVQEKPAGGMSDPLTCLRLEWQAAKMPSLFPFMQAELSVYPLTSTETQLDFSGTYEPPLGPVGKALNAVAFHRIAESSVHRFVADVAEYLRQALAPAARV